MQNILVRIEREDDMVLNVLRKKIIIHIGDQVHGRWVHHFLNSFDIKIGRKYTVC